MKSKSTPHTLPTWAVYLILASAAVVLAYAYYYITAKPYYDTRLELHQRIITAQAPSPYQYRVLIPFIGEGLIRFFELFLAPRYAFSLTYALLDVGGIFLLLSEVFLSLASWFRREYALFGSLFCAAVLPVTFFEHFFQPWSFWEAAIYISGLWLIWQNKRAWLAVCVLLAALNRETGLLVIAAFFLSSVTFKSLKAQGALNWRDIKWTILYLGIWAVVFFGLRLIRPASSEVETLAQIFQHNTKPVFLAKAVLNWLLFAGIFWLLAVRGWRHAPFMLRRAALVLPFHLVLILVFAYWSEVRVLMPHYATLIGLGFSSFGEEVFLPPQGERQPLPPESDENSQIYKVP